MNKQFKIDYATFKQIFLYGNAGFNWHVEADISICHLLMTLEDGFGFHCDLDTASAEYTVDFPTWSWMAGDWDYKTKSWDIDFGNNGGSTVYNHMFVNDYDQPAAALMYKGHLEITNHNDRDRLRYYVIDKDGVYAPPGTKFRTFVDRILGSASTIIMDIVPPVISGTSSRSRVLPGLYIELEYIKAPGGQNDCKVLAHLDYEFKEP